jgi:hypothetical protein
MLEGKPYKPYKYNGVKKEMWRRTWIGLFVSFRMCKSKRMRLMRSQRLILKLPNYTKVTIITNINHSLNKEQFLEKLIAVKTHMKDFRLQGQAEKWSKQMSDIPRQMEKF